MILVVVAAAHLSNAHRQACGQVEYTWENPGEGSWLDNANWLDPNGSAFVPSAFFDESGRIENGGTAFVDQVLDSTANPDQNPAGVVLGRGNNTSGTLEIRSGGSMHVTAGMNSSGNVLVGASGIGVLRVLPGGTLLADGTLTLGANPANMLQVGGNSGANASLSARALSLSGPAQYFPNGTIASSSTLVLGDTSSQTFEVTSAGNAKLQVTERAGLGGNLHLNFTGVSPGLGDSWTVLEAGSITGDFSSITSSLALPIGQALAVAKVPLAGGGSRLDVSLREVLFVNIDRDSGAVTVSHDGTGTIEIDGYSLLSASGALTPDTWNSLVDQNTFGANWVESNPSNSNLSELNPLAAATVNGGQSITLGNVYNPYATSFGQSAEDLRLEYTGPDGAVALAAVSYSGTKVNNLLLQVDPATGQTHLRNTSNSTVSIDGYIVESASSSLNQTSWSSLDEQGAEGGSWVEMGTTTNGRLGELNPTSATELAPGANVDLGQMYATGGSQDLTFEFVLAGEEQSIHGVILYEALQNNALAGDYNGNGTVDAADYTVWKDAFGSTTDLAADGNDNGVIDAADYTIWKDNFGQTAGSVANVSAVPEPASLVLVCLALVAIAAKRPR